MSLLEAMSFGCVPITTMVGSIPTIINDKESGVAINSHSSEDIVKAVKYLMANPDRRETISNNAQKTILGRFSPTEYCTHLNMGYQAFSNS